MYMLREVCQAERGKAPEIVAAFKTLDQWFEKARYTNRRIYVDYTGPMDTVVTSGNLTVSTSTSPWSVGPSSSPTRTPRH